MAQAAEQRLRKILGQPSTVSQLEQLCGTFGWGRSVSYEEEAGWVAVVTCGPGERYRVESRSHQPKTKKGKKEGRAAAAAEAVKALQSRAESMLAQTPVALKELFAASREVEVLESGPAAWSRLRAVLKAAEGAQRTVGVCTEGNDGSGLPVLVQVATHAMAILEMPRARGELSPDIGRLLADPTITKVFCDSPALRDIRSLGLTIATPGVVNLEQLAADSFGQSSASRGLAKIAGLVLGVFVDKGDAQGWAEFEQGTAARKLSDFSDEAQRYAATEAHCILQTWEALQRSSAQSECSMKVVVGSAPSAGTAGVAGEVRREASRKATRKKRKDEALHDIDEEIRALEEKLRTLDGGQRGVRTWTSWRRAMDKELLLAGGVLTWWELRDRLVQRYRASRKKVREGVEARLRVQALACIPKGYCSRLDELVRFPPGSAWWDVVEAAAEGPPTAASRGAEPGQGPPKRRRVQGCAGQRPRSLRRPAG